MDFSVMYGARPIVAIELPAWVDIPVRQGLFSERLGLEAPLAD